MPAQVVRHHCWNPSARISMIANAFVLASHYDSLWIPKKWSRTTNATRTLPILPWARPISKPTSQTNLDYLCYRLLSSPSTNIWVLCKYNIKTMQSCLDISKLTCRACMKYIERPTLYYCLKSDWIFVLESCWYMSTNSSSCLNPHVALHITIISPISQTKFINVEKWKTLHCSLPEWHFECCNTANNANMYSLVDPLETLCCKDRYSSRHFEKARVPMP